jgi:hypothetical protein
MNLAHLHLLLNHFPTIGTIAGFGLLSVAFITGRMDTARASLIIFVIIALLTIPVYVTGGAAQVVLAGMSDPPELSIRSHRDAALLAFVFMQLTGLVAWLGLWQSSRESRPRTSNLAAVLLLTIVTLVLMARAANIGGEIRHPEIASTEPATTLFGPTSDTIASFVINYAWVWPASETLHFIGLGFLFTVVIVNLRLLGVMKNSSFDALHRLLPWAMLGFVMNSITGMLFFIAAGDQYVYNIAFYWKMLFIVLCGVNVLYLTLSRDASAVRAGDDAPVAAKVIAGAGVLLWFGVVFWGRLLPFLGLTF